MASDPSATPLIGRVAELRELSELLGTTGGATSGRSVVLLGGDAGAGKSRLVVELGRQAIAGGWRVLLGHCLDFGDGSPPYLPFSDALGRLAGQSPELTNALAAASPSIARLLPAHRVMGAEDTPEPTGRGALFEAVQDTLTRLGQHSPVLLIIEDVHWADQSSRDLLRWLFTREYGAPVALLVTYRSDDLHRRHPLRAALAEWVRLPSVARLQLGPLSTDESRQLVRALHPDSIGESDVQHILMRAEGNPFFLEELVAAAEVSGDLPADLADLLLVRLEQLGDDGRLVVRAAAVAGRRVSHALLYAATDLDDSALETGLRAAVDANILVAVGADGYAFRHALLAEAIYTDLLPGERVRLHAAYAAALASHGVDGSAAELSRHARASHDLPTATRASVQAGDEAMAVGGPDEALRHYELALELLSDPRVADIVPDDGDVPDGVDRIHLVISASMAASAAGHLARSVSLAQAQLDALPSDAPPRDRARLIHAMVHTALLMDNNLDLLGLTTEAVRLVADEPVSALRAHVLYVHARANVDRARDDDAARWAAEALAIAREIQLVPIITDATLLLAKLNERAGDPDAAQAAIESAIDEAMAAKAQHAELRGRYTLASVHYGRGRIALARSLYDEAAQRARTLGRPWAPYGLDAVVFGAIAAHVGGDWDVAADMADMTGESPPEIAAAIFAAITLAIAADRGDTEALTAMSAIRATWSLDGLIAITSGGAAIDLYAFSGDLAAAIAVHDDAVRHVSELWQRPSFHARVRLAALLVGHLATSAAAATGVDREALVRRGDELVADVLPIVDEARFGGPEGIAWGHRILAEHARLHWLAGIDAPPEAGLVEIWQQTADAFETFGHIYETARSRARLAAVLQAAGDASLAASQAGLAHDTASRLGARPLLAELRGVTGGGADKMPDARDSRTRDSEALTPREHDVLVQVATGRSNREIAQQLFISAKTVSVHISNVMAKLDAASRTEAVAVARRKGLID